MRLAHDRRLRRGSHRLAQTQAGETIMEVLLAIVLMGIGFTAILSGLFTSAKVAQVNQRNTEAALALQALAEAIVQPATGSQPSTYIPCAGYDGDNDASTGDQYKDAMSNTPPAVQQLTSKGWTWRVSNIKYFRRVNQISPAEPDIMKTWDSPGIWSQQSCRNSMASLGGKDYGMQEITIELSNPTTLPGEEQITRQVIVVKRDRSCPTGTYVNTDTGPC